MDETTDPTSRYVFPALRVMCPVVVFNEMSVPADASTAVNTTALCDATDCPLDREPRRNDATVDAAPADTCATWRISVAVVASTVSDPC